MNKKELIAKLEQIEEQAKLTLDEFPLHLTKERQRMIIALTRHVRSELANGEVQPDSPTQAVLRSVSRL